MKGSLTFSFPFPITLYFNTEEFDWLYLILFSIPRYPKYRKLIVGGSYGRKRPHFRFQEKARRKDQVKQKFNGHLVRSLTGLEGKNLGAFISKYKKRFMDFDDFILKSNQSFIEADILDFFEKSCQV